MIGEDGDLEKQRNDLDAERRAFSEATQRLGEERRRLEVSHSLISRGSADVRAKGVHC